MDALDHIVRSLEVVLDGARNGRVVLTGGLTIAKMEATLVVLRAQRQALMVRLGMICAGGEG